jgi:hypothetical protein
MSDPPEFFLFILANLFVLSIGTALTALSLATYRRHGNPTHRVGAVAFGAITLGGVADAIYELGVRGSYEITGRELLALHSVESILIGAGLASLFYALRYY